MSTKVLDRITIYETKADHLIDLTKTAIITYDSKKKKHQHYVDVNVTILMLPSLKCWVQ